MPEVLKKLLFTPQKKTADPIIMGAVFILAIIGIVMIYSSSHYIAMMRESFGNNRLHFMILQGRAALIGLFGMLVASRIDYRKLKHLILPGYLFACGLLVYARIFSPARNNVWRWVTIGPVNFQPSEFAKVTVILLLSLFIVSRRKKEATLKNSIIELAVCGAIIATPVALVLWGRNLSTAIIISTIGFMLIFISNKYWARFFVMGGSLVAGLLGYLFLIARPTNHYHWDRFQLMWDPFADPQGIGYQTVQSLYAVASGGWFGLGLGNSNQSRMFMPEPYNDFIFAVIAEELGFFGAGLVLALFALLIWRGAVTAMRAPDMFGSLIAAGATALIGIQVAINVGVVTNSIPNTGVPLPFISYGGTSVVFILALMGILLNISRHVERNTH